MSEVSSSSDTRDVVDNLRPDSGTLGSLHVLLHTTTHSTFRLVGYVRTRLLQAGQPGTSKPDAYSGQ